MFVVHVHVHVNEEDIRAFREATIILAQDSMEEPGVVRFDGFDDFLVSNLSRSGSNSVSVIMAVAMQADSQGGFAVSDNHMDSNPNNVAGFGIFFEGDGHVRTIAGREVRYSSAQQVGTALQIVSAVADSSRMSLWIDLSLIHI